MNEMSKALKAFLQKTDYSNLSIEKALPRSTNNAEVFILSGEQGRFHAFTGMDLEECEYLIAFNRHFRKFHVPLPEIVSSELSSGSVLQEYISDITLLHSVREETKVGEPLNESLNGLYQNILNHLVTIQIPAGKELIQHYGDRTIPYNESKILDDLSHFVTSYLPHADVSFDEERVRGCLGTFAKQLAKIPGEYFYYRDLNTRNILVKDDKPYFIDYQGGRKGFIGCLTGPLELSLLSLLNHSRAALIESDREQLIEYYLKQVAKHEQIDTTAFLENYRALSLLKLLQILGAYGDLGFRQGKAEFRDNLPAVLNELESELSRFPKGYQSSETEPLFDLLKALVNS